MGVVPVPGEAQALPHVVGGFVAQQRAGAGDVRQRMAHVPGAEVAVDRFGFGGFRLVADDFFADEREQLGERGPLAERHVVDLVPGRVVGAGGQQVGLHHVVDVAEVAGGFSVAVDVDRRALGERGEPQRDHGGVGSVRVLPLPEDVEVAQADGREAVAAREDFGVQLVHVLGHRVGGQRLADAILLLGQGGLVAVGGARSSVDEALRPGVARRHQHVEEAVDVAAVGQNGIFK